MTLSLPAPSIIETLDFEALLAERKAALLALYPSASGVIDNEAEPLNYLLQESCYRELILRQRVNDSVLAVMLAYAKGDDLDAIGIDRFGMERLTITEATDTEPAVMESDDAYRERLVLSRDQLSTAGPASAYESLARGADGDVAAAKATSPSSGVILVSVISHTNNGSPSQAILAAVERAASDDEKRPLTDHVTVNTAGITTVSINAELILESGSDANGASEILAQARAAAEQLKARRVIGEPLEISQVYAALHITGVRSVTLISPTSTVPVYETDAVIVTSVSVTLADDS